MKIRIKKLSNKAVMPTKAHTSDAGFDITATSREIDEYGNIVYGTGLAFEIPEGNVGLLFPRSSIFKKDNTLTNSVGVIDCHYRGEVKAKFKMSVRAFRYNSKRLGERYYPDIDNHNSKSYEVGERIAQLIIMPLPEVEIEESDELSETDRGEGGYGSTGK